MGMEKQIWGKVNSEYIKDCVLKDHKKYTGKLPSGIVREIARNFQIDELEEAENIKITDEDIEAAEKMVMDAYGIDEKEALYEQYTKDDITYYAIAEKVFDFVLENGTPVTGQ